MDNKIFNVNGKDKEQLLDTLRLAFRQHGRTTRAVAWMHHEEKGMILFWHDSVQGVHKLPGKMDADQVLDFVSSYLLGDMSKEVVRDEWDRELENSDATMHSGFRVYCEDWGHVAGYSAAICAIKPVALWYGK